MSYITINAEVELSIREIADMFSSSEIDELLGICGRERGDIPAGEARAALERASEEMEKLGLYGVAARLDDIRREVF